MVESRVRIRKPASQEVLVCAPWGQEKVAWAPGEPTASGADHLASGGHPIGRLGGTATIVMKNVSWDINHDANIDVNELVLKNLFHS